MSFDDSKKSVMKTIKLGACDYMIKPLHEDRLRNMWTHVVRKSMNENKMRKKIGNSLEDDNQNSKFVFSSSDEISREVDNAGESKKSRVVWTTELHGIFVKAVNQIGLASMILQPFCSIFFFTVHPIYEFNAYYMYEIRSDLTLSVFLLHSHLLDAVPNKILQLMNTPHLTRNNVASHLQVSF